MLFIHQRKLLHENQIITVPTSFFKALCRSIKFFAVHFVFRKMMTILSCRWCGRNSLIYVTTRRHKAQFDPSWSFLTPINIATITKHNQIICVKTQCEGLCGGVRALLNLSDWLGSSFILMPLTLTEATPKGEKWDIKKQVTFESIYTSGKHSSEVVRSDSLIEILCCLHLLERQEEPQQNFTMLAFCLLDTLCLQINK